jgi:hypothetical protein
VQVDELVRHSVGRSFDPLVQPIQLLLGRDHSVLEARQLGVPTAPQNSPLGHDHAHIREMSGTDGDPACRADAAMTVHRSSMRASKRTARAINRLIQ